MVEYGKSNTVSIKKRTPPTVLFGIALGEISHLDYEPDTKLKVPQEDLLIFFRQMSVMLKSGVPLAQSLELLAENVNNKKFGSNIYDVSKRLGGGEELSSSLEIYQRIFSPIMIGLIEAGEAGGILSQVLERLAALIEAQSKIRSQIKGALIYPVLILVLAISVSLGLLIFIVPKFETLFSGMGAKLPALTAFMLSLSRFVTSWSFAIGAPIVLFVSFYAFNISYASPQGRRFFDNLILKTPLFGDLILKSEVAQMSDTLSTLINSGIPFSNTIGAKQFFPSTLMTLEVIFETTGLLLPFIFPLFKPEIYAGNLNNPWDSEPSLSAFIIKSDKMFDVSSSHPLASKVLLARL